MNDPLCTYLSARGEHLAAGFAELPAAPIVRRMGRGMRRHLERCPLPEGPPQPLYPAGRYAVWGLAPAEQGPALRFHYSYPLNFDAARWQEHIGACPDPAVREGLARLGDEWARYPMFTDLVPPEFRLGGNGYTHSILHYGRVLDEGLEGYARRVGEGLEAARAAADGERIDLFLALRDLLAGMRAYHARALADLARRPPSMVRDRLLDALQRVPWLPARGFYEGLAAVDFLYYLDGCDNLGRLDQVLGARYEADLNAGRVTMEEGEGLVRLLWENVDANDGWNVALGGTAPDGQAAYNGLTLACLRAARHIRRPNLALRVRDDMPQEHWDAALEAIASGCGLPALYNERFYLDALRDTGLVDDAGDRSEVAFGGCTETMVHGRSNVGSLDAGLNLVQVLAGTLARALPRAPGEVDTFAAFLACFREDVARAVARLAEAVSRQQALKARCHPQLLRTLLIDDCLQRGVEYNAGGARYNWSVINLGGLGNVVDSLAAIREVVYDRREVDGATLWRALQADYAGDEGLRRRLERCPRYGNDDRAADDLAAAVSAHVFGEFARHTPWRGGRFLPGCLMFVRYVDAGLNVMATPDGRRANAPIADSAGPVAGRDRHGPTAMMRSVSRLDMQGAPGTLVVNMRLDGRMFREPADREKTKALIRSYFALGNMQLQVNVVDQDTLEAALADPERYGDLVERVAGYSEYWGRLTPELRRTVLERTIHSV